MRQCSDPKQPPDPPLHFTVRVRLSGRPYPGRILHRNNWTCTCHFVLVFCSLLNAVEIYRACSCCTSIELSNDSVDWFDAHFIQSPGSLHHGESPSWTLVSQLACMSRRRYRDASDLDLDALWRQSFRQSACTALG